MRLFTLAVLSILAVRPAHADLIRSASFSLISSSTGPVLGTVAVPQFDPVLGTLNSVTLTVLPSVQFVLEVFNNGPGAVSVTAADTFTFGGIALPVQGVFSSTIPANQTVYAFMPAALPDGPLTEMFGSNTANFFAGTATVPFDLSFAPATVVQFSGATTNGVLAFSGVSGTVTADYAFTAAAPEPATFCLLGLGGWVLFVLTRWSLAQTPSKTQVPRPPLWNSLF